MDDLKWTLCRATLETCEQVSNYTESIHIEGLVAVTVNKSSSLLFRINGTHGTMSKRSDAWKQCSVSDFPELQEKLEMSLLSICWERLADIEDIKIEGMISLVVDNADIVLVYLDKLTHKEKVEEQTVKEDGTNKENEVVYIVLEEEAAAVKELVEPETLTVKEESSSNPEESVETQAVVHVEAASMDNTYLFQDTIEVEPKEEVVEEEELDHNAIHIIPEDTMETDANTEDYHVEIGGEVGVTATQINGTIDIDGLTEASLENTIDIVMKDDVSTVIVEGSPQSSLQQILLETLTGVDRQQAAVALSALSEERVVQDINAQKQYVCPVCDKYFNNKKSLSWHCKQRHPTLPRPDTKSCGRCGKQFGRNSHVCRFGCPRCTQVFTSRVKLNAHIREQRNDEKHKLPFRCSTCNQRFTKLKYLKQHEKTYHVSSLFDLCFHKLIGMQHRKQSEKWNCFLCERKLANYSMLKKHVMQHKHSGELATEAMINQIYNGDVSVVSLFREEVKPLVDICISKVAKPACRSNREFACKLCPKSGLSKFDLLRHLQIHLRKIKEGSAKKHGHRKFICPHCFRKFATEKNRDIHIDAHHFSKKLKCEECNREYKNMFNLERHLALHDFHNKVGSSTSLLRKYKCPHTGCNSSYTTDAKLQEHLQEPHNITDDKLNTPQKHSEKIILGHSRQKKRPYKKQKKEVEVNTTCSFCNKCFAQAQHLKRHLKLHEAKSSKLRPHQCDKCTSCFGSENKLKLHISVKHEGKESKKRAPVKVKTESDCKFICQFCGFLCSNNFNLRRHEKRYHSETPVRKRGRPSFAEEPNVDKFRLTNGEFSCPICGRLTKSSYAFRRHVRIHGDLIVQNGETVLVLDENLQIPEIVKIEMP